MEIRRLMKTQGSAVELVDNDETASQIACLVHAGTLLILSGLDGIYRDLHDPSTLIREISGATADEVIANIDETKKLCYGASRAGANGASAKLEYIKPCVRQGTTVIIGSANYDLAELLDGRAPATRIRVR